MPQVINTVTKAAPTDNYPVVRDVDLSGSYRIVANLTERDAIVSTQRKQSMLVFVISDLHFYQLQSDLLTWTDLGLSLGGSGFAPPIVRYVYLVQDASDAVRMGGTSNNTYTTFQAAYDAANTLQILLGGSNRVVIMVGNTTSATVGSVALTASWNSNVKIVGESRETSIVGNIILTGAFSINTLIANVTLGNITAEGGITLILNTSSIGSLVTSSTTGASGNISFVSSFNSTIGSITSSASLGNVGSLTFSTCTNLLMLGAVTMTQTSTIASFSVGTFTMTNCDNCRFTSTVTITMAFATSTGTIGGINIGSTNQNILFSGNFRITGYANNTNIASDVAINNIILFNTSFGAFFVNNRTAGSNNWEGGIITNLNIQKCFFRSRTRISYHNVTPVTTGLTFRITDCIFKGTTDGTGLDFYTLNTDVSFDVFIVSSCQSNFQDGFSIGNNPFVPQTVPFTIDGVSVILNNLTIDVFYGEFVQPTTPNSVYDVVVSGGVYNVFEMVLNGDMNVNFSETEVTNSFYLANNTAPSLKRTLISGSNLVMNNGAAYGLHFYNVPVFLRNSYMSYYTNILNPLTQDIISYNSFIESFAETGSVTTWTGSIKTSTLRRLVTDSVLGLTVSANSLDEAY